MYTSTLCLRSSLAGMCARIRAQICGYKINAAVMKFRLTHRKQFLYYYWRIQEFGAKRDFRRKVHEKERNLTDRGERVPKIFKDLFYNSALSYILQKGGGGTF